MQRHFLTKASTITQNSLKVILFFYILFKYVYLAAECFGVHFILDSVLMFTAVQCAFTGVFVCPMLNVCLSALYLYCKWPVCVFHVDNNKTCLRRGCKTNYGSTGGRTDGRNGLSSCHGVCAADEISAAAEAAA